MIRWFNNLKMPEVREWHHVLLKPLTFLLFSQHKCTLTFLRFVRGMLLYRKQSQSQTELADLDNSEVMVKDLAIAFFWKQWNNGLCTLLPPISALSVGLWFLLGDYSYAASALSFTHVLPDALQVTMTIFHSTEVMWHLKCCHAALNLLASTPFQKYTQTNTVLKS